MFSCPSGVSFGLAVGGFEASTPLAGVSRDAASGIYRPSTLAQWQTVFNVSNVAVTLVQANTWVWLCDEASGNLVDKINGLALAPNATPAYQQTVSGWTATAVKMTDGTANQRFSSTDTSLPDIGTENGSLLAIVKFDSVGGVRGVGALGTTRAGMRHTGASPRMVCNVTTTSGAQAVGTSVARPWWIQHDETGSTQELVTDQEKVAGVFDGGVTGKSIQVGGTDATPATANYLYLALFKGVPLTAAQRKAILQTLGYPSIPW